MSEEDARLQEVERALRAILPPHLQGDVSDLTRLLLDAVRDGAATDEVRRHLQALPTIKDIVEALAGRTLEVPKAQIAFGEGSQLGDVAIRDVAGGNIIHLTVNAPPNRLPLPTIAALVAAAVLIIVAGSALLWGALLGLGPTAPLAPAATTAGAAAAAAHTTTATAAPATATAPSSAMGAPKADVIIAQFDNRSASRTFEVARRLESNLLGLLREYDLDEVSVEVVPQPMTTGAELAALAATTRSKVVIWGWYDDLGIKVRIFLVEPDASLQEIPGTVELPLELGEAGDTELAFVVRDLLPENVSFLSLFVIGHLKYGINDVPGGLAAYDAAMSNIPAQVAIENEAVIRFFTARQLAAGGGDANAVVCEYSRAIELDPGFAEAYNNLGVFLADFRELSEAGVACLNRVRTEHGGSVEFFEKAASLRPTWVIPRYNLFTFQWSNSSDAEELKAALLDLERHSPDIAGVQIGLGNLAFEEGALDTAAKRYLAAQALAPESAKIRFNLGQAYVRLDRLDEAEATFKDALERDPDDSETHLALANLALLSGDAEATASHLEAILAAQERIPADVVRAADVLRSRGAFEAGRTTEAIAIFQERAAEAGGTLPVFESYLLALLLSEDGQGARAEALWPASTGGALSDNWPMTPEGLRAIFLANNSFRRAWHTLIIRCASPTTASAGTWGTAENPCLPTELDERIAVTYDALQESLPYRLYYQQVLPAEGLACPYVFTYDPAAAAWLMDTTILYNLSSREHEATQMRSLRRFDGRIIIKELEPEVSYIDQVYVLAIDEAGRATRLLPAVDTLQRADGDYVVLEQGEELLVPFDDLGSAGSWRSFYIVARGYYVPVVLAP